MIIENFSSRAAGDYASADFGVALNLEEQRLRYVIKSLLRADGVSRPAYQRRFGGSLTTDLPQLSELSELGLADESIGSLRLNDEGLTWSDTIGPWLYSDAMTARMNAYELV